MDTGSVRDGPTMVDTGTVEVERMLWKKKSRQRHRKRRARATRTNGIERGSRAPSSDSFDELVRIE